MRSDFVFALENAPWPALVLNDSAMIVRANSSAAAMFAGVTEAGGSSAASFWSQENDSTMEVFLARLERSQVFPLPLKLRIKEGSTAVFESHVSSFSRDGQRFYLFQAFRGAASQGAQPGARFQSGSAEAGKPQSLRADAAESQQAMRHKLECALQLSRSVAMDLNNVLTSILGHTSMLLDRLERDHPWIRSLLEIEKAAEKAASVASDLARFSRQEKEAAQRAGNLNDIVRNAVETFRTMPASGALVTWNLQLEPNVFAVSADETKVQQAITKILQNAIEALSGQGEVTIRTSNCDAAESRTDGNTLLPAGLYVCVECRDSGPGIPQDILPRVFEPFFSTKQAPAHRGLGLAWVYGIVTNHGGRVAISSDLGRGTVVRLYLPAQKKVIRDLALQGVELIGTQAILVIDDEELVLGMLETVLSSFGYRVVTASTAEVGVELFSLNAGQIDLVITELVMPGKNGRELIGELRHLSPSVPIICSSGHLRPSGLDEDVFYLTKPYSSLDLLRKVKQALINSDAS
jgi:two-component system, cell cycle sensor histidine kinase and response regulator CckA